MACEVEGQAYLFHECEIGEAHNDPEPFYFNPLHDLESWWWILNWVLHFHVDSDSQIPPPGHAKMYQKCFPGLALAPGTTRVHVLCAQMATKTFPPSFHTTVRWLDNMRIALLKCYREAEHTLPVELEYQKPSMKLCQFMLDSIRRARKEVKSVTLKPSDLAGKHQAEHGLLPARRTKRRKEE